MSRASVSPSSFSLNSFNFSNSTNMDPLIGGALISAGSGIVSGLFGNKSSKRALQAQRETNEMNYKIWQEQ